MVWKIPVTWEMCGCVHVEAGTLEEAMEIAKDSDGKIPLPADGAYVDESWSLSCSDPEDVRLFQKSETRKEDRK